MELEGSRYPARRCLAMATAIANGLPSNTKESEALEKAEQKPKRKTQAESLEATIERGRRAQELEESERLKKELRLQFGSSSQKVGAWYVCEN